MVRWVPSDGIRPLARPSTRVERARRCFLARAGADLCGAVAVISGARGCSMWERSGNASGTSPPLIHTMYFIVCRPHDPDSTALSRVMRHEGIRPRAMAHDPKVGPFHVRTISSHTIGRATSETHPPDTRQVSRMQREFPLHASERAHEIGGDLGLSPTHGRRYPPTVHRQCIGTGVAWEVAWEVAYLRSTRQYDHTLTTH